MITPLKVALVQMLCEKGEPQKNLKIIKRYIDLAETARAHVIVFPELSIGGYISPLRHAQHVYNPRISRVMQKFYSLTRGKRLTAIAGFAEQTSRKPHISQAVAAKGKLIGIYRKRHVAKDERAQFSASDMSPTFVIKGVRVGITLCADINKEEPFAEAAKNGAEVVFHCSAPGLWHRRRNETHWVKRYEWWRKKCFRYLPRYAKRSNVFIASTTQTGRTVNEDFPGGMYVFNPRGACIAQSNDYLPSSLIVNLEIRK